MNRMPSRSFMDLVVWQKSHDPQHLEEVASLLGGYIAGIERARDRGDA